ncbi:Group 1 glycosyl transferase [Candidatus Magnetomoraceae bacterium gMMP-15]
MISHPFTLITMSLGNAFETWQNAGLITRELGYYSELSKHIGQLGFLSYGTDESCEQNYLNQHLLNANVKWTMPKRLSDMRYGNLFASFLSTLNKSKLINCKLIRSNQMSGAWAGAILAKRLGVPFILRCGYILSKNYAKEHKDNLIHNIIFHALEQWAAKIADAVIVSYPGAKQFFVEQHGISPQKIHILGNPINIKNFRPLNLEPARDVISVGRFTNSKNLHSLIHACKLTNSSLTLLGNGPLKSDLKRLAYEINADVDFHKPIQNDKVPQLLAKHRIFVLPSLYEGNPKALLEAMSCGLPCIASRIKEHQDIIEDAKEGLLCGTSAEEIAECIKHLKKEPEFSACLGKSARQKILCEYSMTGIAKKEALLHKELLHKNRANRRY